MKRFAVVLLSATIFAAADAAANSKTASTIVDEITHAERQAIRRSEEATVEASRRAAKITGQRAAWEAVERVPGKGMFAASEAVSTPVVRRTVPKRVVQPTLSDRFAIARSTVSAKAVDLSRRAGTRVGSSLPFNRRHVEQASNVRKLDESVTRLAKRSVREGARARDAGMAGIPAGNHAEAVFRGYLNGLNRRLARYDSPYVIEWQPAIDSRYGRIPDTPWRQGSRRADAALSDCRWTSEEQFPTPLRLYDITLNARKKPAISKYETAFGAPVRDIRPVAKK